MTRSPIALMLLLTLSAPALAQESEGTYLTRLLPPESWDLHFGVLADGLLRDASLSIAADYGIGVVGSGTMGIGLELNGGRCVLGCTAFGGADGGWEYGVGFVRVAFHIPLTGETSGVAETGVYGLALVGGAGLVQSTQSGSWTSVGPAGGIGLGSVHFPGNGDKLFVGGELRLVYATSIGASMPWNLFGVGFRLTLGVRL